MERAERSHFNGVQDRLGGRPVRRVGLRIWFDIIVVRVYFWVDVDDEAIPQTFY